jgi:tetratricopeptide (TPR) repeat protein
MKMNVRSLIFIAIVLVFFTTSPISGYSDNAVSRYSIGLALTGSGNYTGALHAFDEAILLEPHYFEAWNGKADALNRAKKYQDALAACDQALAINPKFVQGWINRGYILYNLGRYEDELKAYDNAIEIDATSADAWFNRGYALAALGRYDDAIQAFDRVAEINPGYPNLQANRRIVEDNRDASKPVIVKLAPWLLLFFIIIGGVGWLVYKKRERR